MRPVTELREHDNFVESPTRPGMTAREVVVGNVTELANAIGLAIGSSLPANIEIRNASITISALKCLYSVDANSVDIASDNINLSKSSVFGVSLTAANINESIQIQTSGTLRDSSFAWDSGTQLYVDSNGSLTDIAPSVGFRTLVATAQGIGQIFINIQEPIIL